jgi:hypothetical protein
VNILRVLGLFDKYFLILMVIQGLILIFDSKIFLKSNMIGIAKKAKSIAISIMILGITLHLITIYISE